MSDREWIDRVRSTRPEDLSSGDLGRLRDEARRSPELRKALADDIQLDQALHASVGRSPLSTSKIVAHVKQEGYRVIDVLPAGDAHAFLVAVYKDPRVDPLDRKDAAKAANRGLWGACNPIPCN